MKNNQYKIINRMRASAVAGAKAGSPATVGGVGIPNEEEVGIGV